MVPTHIDKNAILAKKKKKAQSRKKNPTPYSFLSWHKNPLRPQGMGSLHDFRGLLNRPE